MALNYKQKDRLSRVLEMQDAYTHWYMNFSRHILSYDIEAAAKVPRPSLFLESIAEQVLDLFSDEHLQVLNKKNMALFDMTDAMIRNAKIDKKDETYEAYIACNEVFDKFFNDVCQFRQSVFYKERGFDKFSGLKNERTMHKDLYIEMERLARDGQEFSLALAQIDDFEKIKGSFGDEKVEEYIKVASSAVIECLRPFDDAYYPRENEFILCLKQANVSGGLRAFQRFEQYLDECDVSYEMDGEQHKLSMSCCVAAPVAGDDVNTLLENLREDIVTVEKVQGMAFSYQETSPLQRYIKSQ